MTDVPAAGERFSVRHYFLIRRLHSLLGLIPLGVFVVFHLTANSLILFASHEGDKTVPGGMYQFAVDGIHLLGPLVYPVEIFGIFLPLLFHAILGIQIALSGKVNAASYRYGGNVRYTLQRITAYITLVFILLHLYQMHWTGGWLPGGSQFDVANAPVTAAQAIQSSWLWLVVYTIGIIATVFHLANGIWTSLITWGITVKPKTQKVSGVLCVLLGIAVGGAGLVALAGFQTMSVDQEVAATTELPH